MLSPRPCRTRQRRSLHWRHNDHGGVSNHQHHGCLLHRVFGRRSKKTSKLHVTGLCVGNSPGPVNSSHKGPVTRKMFPFDDVIMYWFYVLNPEYKMFTILSRCEKQRHRYGCFNPENNSVIVVKNKVFFLMLFAINVIVLWDRDPMRFISSHHCGYEWFGAATPGPRSNIR